MNADRMERALLDFINGTLRRGSVGVTATDRLFEDGFLDSIRVLELIRFIEETTGRQVPERHVRLASFRSVRAIVRTFAADVLRPPDVDVERRYHTAPERFASPIAELRRDGDLSGDDNAPRLAGRAALLFGFFDATFARWARELGADDVEAPALISRETLDRAGFLAEFPQLLVPAGDDQAFSPAACYHRYAALADSTLDTMQVLGVVARCRRAEREPRPLERAVEFTMRETVVLGTRQDVARVHHRMLRRIDRFVTALSLDGVVQEASDPFFVRESASALAQKAGGLKRELRLTLEGGRDVAVASLNRHHDYFGRRFSISIGGEPAHSGCVAFGIERWVLAFLTQHGLDESRWPPLVRDAIANRRAHAAR